LILCETDWLQIYAQLFGFAKYLQKYFFFKRDCRTIALEVGMQNAGLASALAKGMGKIATVGLASVIFLER
jgi:predicted Na+-dependent transporter